MESSKILSYYDQKTGYTLKPVSDYEWNGRHFLFEKEGHILLADGQVVSQLTNKRISEGLCRKLLSRGFFIKNTLSDQPGDAHMAGNHSELPEFFMIDMTNRCNMQCRYCLRNVNRRTRSIQKDVLSDICSYIMDYCETAKIRDVTIQPWGGEPLLELDKILMMRKLLVSKKTRIHFSIETNALLLDEKTTQQLYNKRIGIGVSIDGTKACHDRQRIHMGGSGTYDIVRQNLLNAQNIYGNRIGTITVITKKNYDSVEEILEHFVCELHLRNVKFNFVHKSVYSQTDTLCLSEEETTQTVVRILNKIVELNERGFIVEEHNITTRLRNLLYRENTDVCKSFGCQGGRKMIVFDMDGNIYPCELTDNPEEKIGSIYDPSPLKEIIGRAVLSKDFYLPKKEPVCNDCDWFIYCKGGCTVSTISCGNRPPCIDKTECAVNRVLYPALICLILKKPDIVKRILNTQK